MLRAGIRGKPNLSDSGMLSNWTESYSLLKAGKTII